MCLYIRDITPKYYRTKGNGFIHAYKSSRTIHGNIKSYVSGRTYEEKDPPILYDNPKNAYIGGYHAFIRKKDLIKHWLSPNEHVLEIVFKREDILHTGIQRILPYQGYKHIVLCPVIVLRKFTVLRRC